MSREVLEDTSHFSRDSVDVLVTDPHEQSVSRRVRLEDATVD